MNKFYHISPKALDLFVSKPYIANNINLIIVA